MVDVCVCLRSRLNAGEYADMREAFSDPWRALQVPSQTVWGPRVEDQEDSDQVEQRSRRLCQDDILKHFRKHGARGTFLASVTSRVLADGSKAKLLYVFPKYRLELGHCRREEIAAALRLGLASTVEDVFQACADPETGFLDYVFIPIIRLIVGSPKAKLVVSILVNGYSTPGTST